MNSRRASVLAQTVFALQLLLLLAATACRQSDGPDEAAASTAPANPLFVDPASHDFSTNPKLLERIRATPHGYYRFINVPFSREVCRRFGDDLSGTPSFNLHGDAHIEQYAVTDLGRGLTDFDDSSTGPAIVDLARFGVSLYLAGEQAGFGNATGVIFDELLRGYRAALEDPTVEIDEPRLAARKRAGFKYDREAYFRFIDSLMEPVPEAEAKGLEESLGPYVEVMLEENAELAADFFAVEGLGYLRQGIGSALDVKYLARVRGASDDPLDDVVLEIKQVRDLTSIDCISVAPGADPFRVLIGQARIATEPYKYLGYARFQNHTFWVHAWVENYSEIDIDDDLRSVEGSGGGRLRRRPATRARPRQSDRSAARPATTARAVATDRTGRREDQGRLRRAGGTDDRGVGAVRGRAWQPRVIV